MNKIDFHLFVKDSNLTKITHHKINMKNIKQSFLNVIKKYLIYNYFKIDFILI